ncbi:MAG: hypothetical protein MK108_13150 [Mariniblastus sp.]|nr:hypothetical protein [Mariniblastus sp.]
MVRISVGSMARSFPGGWFVYPLFLLALPVFLASGCDLNDRREVALVEVHGVVQLDGQPVENARVLFLPLEHQLEPDFALSYGVTDSEGNYELHQNGLRAGAMAGRHRVFISKPLGAAEAESPGPKRMGLDLQSMFSGGAGPSNRTDNAIPQHYNESSDLVFEVIAGQGANRADFDLKTVDPLLN